MKVVLILLFFQVFTQTQAAFYTFLTELKHSCNPTFLKCKSWVKYTTENDPSTYLVNINGEIIKPGLNNLMANVKIFKAPVGKRNESQKVLDMHTNLCMFFRKKNRGNVFSGYFIALVKRFGKIPTCPIKPDLYYVHNMTTKDFVLPSFSGFLLGNGDTSFVFRHYATYKKKVVSLENVTFIGGYRNS